MEALESRWLMAGDAFEENDTLATARILPAGSGIYSGLTLDDDDYYRWTASGSPNGTLRVDLLFSAVQGDIDLEVLDSSGTTLGLSDRFLDNEHLEIQVTGGQTYYIRAYGPAGATNLDGYTMRLSEILPDIREPNNASGSATLIPDSLPSFTNLTLHRPDDEDWFRFVAASNGIFRAQADFSHADGDVDLVLRDAGLAILTSSEGSDDQELISASLSAGQTVYLQVVGADGATSPGYSLDLDFGQPPQLSGLPSGVVTAIPGVMSSYSFSISDPDTPVASLGLHAVSDNPNILPTGNMWFDRSGASPILKVFPTGSGAATITVTVEDGVGSDSDTFTLFVGGLAFPPSISNIANQTTSEDVPLTDIPFVVNDLDSIPTSLIVTATSSAPSLIAPEDITLGGSGSSRTLSIAPRPNRHGTATITVRVEDEDQLVAEDTLVVTVEAVADQPALTAGNVNGNEDTAIPLGLSAALVDADGSEALAVEITGVPAGAHLSAGVDLGGGIWHLLPQQLPGLTLTPPADSTTPIGLTVTAIATESSNGSQSERLRPIFVSVHPINDDPTISDLPSQATPLDTPIVALPLTVADLETPVSLLAVTGSSDNPALIPDGNIVVGGSGASRTVTITPAPGAAGVAAITLLVDDAMGGTATEQFTVAVGVANEANPTIGAVDDQVVNEGATLGPLAFTVGDTQTSPADLLVSVSSSDPNLIPVEGIVLGGSGESRTVSLTPAPNQVGGPVTITLTVDDGRGGQASESFLVTVVDVDDPPTISAIDDVTIDEDTSTAAIAFLAWDEESGAPSVTVTSNNPTLLPAGSITLGGSGASRFLVAKPAANRNGTARITVQASDGAHTTTEEFTLFVNPVNDPPTISSITNRTVNQNTTLGPIFFTIGDDGTPAGSLVVDVTSGNQALVSDQKIILGGAGGSLSLTVTPERNQFGGPMPITISVTDGEGLTATRTFNLTVLQTNQAPDIANAAVNINENTANGTPVYDVNDSTTGTDLDGDDDPITYSIVGGNSSGAFAIKSSTGAITVADSSKLDFETTSTFNLMVQASDGSLTDTATITVHLTNLNDNVPNLADRVVSLNENAANATVVVDLNNTGTGNDKDADGQSLTYSINGGSGSSAFMIQPSTGIITVTDSSQLDFETTPVLVLNVSATDGTTADTAVITIQLNNLNDNNPSLADQVVSINENAANATVVVDLNNVGTGNDKDADGQSLTYSIIAGNSSGAFAIGASTGVITVADSNQLDFETTPSYVLTVRASDGTRTDEALVTIQLNNLNDNPPDLVNRVVSIQENSPNGTTVADLNNAGTNNDQDADGQPLTYSINSGNSSGAFAIQPSTGIITVADSSRLDFETTPSFVLTVTASDGSATDQATVTINLLNVDDNSPDVNRQSASINENAPNGTLVLDVNDAQTGFDVDLDGQALAYAITAGNTGAAFAIHPATGAITVANSSQLDFETTPVFNLTVQASDGVHIDSATVTVTLLNVNDNAPLLADATVQVDENSPNGTPVIDLHDVNTGGDIDRDGNPLSYQFLSGNALGAFAIVASTGIIRVADGSKLDFETSPTFVLGVQASDGVNVDQATITIQLNQVNDNGPQILNAIVSLDENSANNTLVVDLNDSRTSNDLDPDGDPLTYSITAGNGAFSIHPTTGIIRVADSSQLDFEAAPSLVLTVTASDGDNEDTATITINLNNLNDNPPVLADRTVSLDENTAGGTPVADLRDELTGDDTDRDGNALTYSITGGNSSGAFSIESTTGVIRVADSSKLDFETTPSFTLTVQASDGLHTDSAAVTVHLNNLNDNSPDLADRSVSIVENSPNGTLVTDINNQGTNNDKDADGNALTYSITGGNSSGAFSIESTTGVIRVADSSKLDFETTPSFLLTVRASDGTFNDSAVVTIHLEDFPEDLTFPAVAAVRVGSTHWTSGYRTAIDPGLGLGYPIPSGAGQLATVAWINLDQIHVTFTEDVVVRNGDLGLFGSQVADYRGQIAGFVYDPATFTATWTLSSPLAADKVLVALSDGITDLAGNQLDGEWTNGVSNFPSGNNQAGTDFHFRINVLPGDVVKDVQPTVLITDVVQVRQAQFTSNLLYDLDGNGIVLVTDVVSARGRQFTRLPSADPVAPDSVPPFPPPPSPLAVTVISASAEPAAPAPEEPVATSTDGGSSLRGTLRERFAMPLVPVEDSVTTDSQPETADASATDLAFQDLALEDMADLPWGKPRRSLWQA